MTSVRILSHSCARWFRDGVSRNGQRNGAKVVIINETMAKSFPQGRRRSVTGIPKTVCHAKWSALWPHQWHRPAYRSGATFLRAYSSIRRTAQDSTCWFRTSGDPATLVPAVRKAINCADPSLPILRLSTLISLISTRFTRTVSSPVVTMFGVAHRGPVRAWIIWRDGDATLRRTM